MKTNYHGCMARTTGTSFQRLLFDIQFCPSFIFPQELVFYLKCNLPRQSFFITRHHLISHHITSLPITSFHIISHDWLQSLHTTNFYWKLYLHLNVVSSVVYPSRPVPNHCEAQDESTNENLHATCQIFKS